MRTVIVLGLLAIAGAAVAQTPQEIRLWPGKAPGSENWTVPEVTTTSPAGDRTISNVSDPSVTVFLPPSASATGTAVVVAPGGALRVLGWDNEGVKVAQWLETRPEVQRVLHPALPSHPQHAIWKRDFKGACGLFSVVLKSNPQSKVNTFIESLSLFGIGASWGGYESLIIPFDCTKIRTARKWNPGGPTVRLHIGLEEPDDLIADLEEGLARLAG